MPTEKSRLAILGGGFGGVYTAKYLWRSLSREERTRTQVSIVSAENYLVFQPMLPEVDFGHTGNAARHQPDPTYRSACKPIRWRVQEVDLVQRRIRLATGYSLRHLELSFDHLVFALGNR